MGCVVLCGLYELHGVFCMDCIGFMVLYGLHRLYRLHGAAYGAAWAQLEVFEEILDRSKVSCCGMTVL